MAELTQKMVDDAGRKLMERGLIVAAGWAGYQLMFKVDAYHHESERRAFFAGAQHLFASIMNSGLDEGAEPTEADLKRMNNIARELKEFERVLERTMH